jgi:hypothetical protein
MKRELGSFSFVLSTFLTEALSMPLSLYQFLGCNFLQADSLMTLFSIQGCASKDNRDRTRDTSGSHTAQAEPDAGHHLPVGYGHLIKG